MDFTIVKVGTPEDHSRVQEFVYKYIYPDMPLSQAFGLQPRTPSPTKHAQNEGDFSLIAIDAQGDIVGVVINKVNFTYVKDPESPPVEVRMMEMLDWIEKDAKLEALPERTIELRVLGVHREWRKQGVAKALTKESMKQARESGFKAMMVCCVSGFTAKLVQSLGWREHYRFRYSDFPCKSGMDINVTPEHPHEYLYYYVVEL